MPRARVDKSGVLDPNAYGAPFLVKAFSKGMFNVDMGIITEMNVTKGAECQWTPQGIPTSITVDIGIKDLYSAMSITPTTDSNFKYTTLDNTSLMDYIATLCGVNIFEPEIGLQTMYRIELETSSLIYLQHYKIRYLILLYRYSGNENIHLYNVVNIKLKDVGLDPTSFTFESWLIYYETKN